MVHHTTCTAHTPHTYQQGSGPSHTNIAHYLRIKHETGSVFIPHIFLIILILLIPTRVRAQLYVHKQFFVN